MLRLEKLQTFKAQGKTALIVYLTSGCPDMKTTLAGVKALENAGADVIELGIPFSDPMADGPVIQTAATIALKAGATTSKVLELVQEIRKASDIPLVAMCYINTILQFGINKFVSEFTKAGLDGLIVPDLPYEEAGILTEVCMNQGLALVQFIAPTTTNDRIIDICKNAQGFIYCVSTTGVTGVREVDYSHIGKVMQLARKTTTMPLAIGFGIGTPEAAQQAAKYADGVIVGSALMDKLMNNGITEAASLIKDMRQALDEGK